MLKNMVKLLMVTSMEKTQNKKFFKNRIEMVITLTIFVLCIIGFIYLGKVDFSKDKPTDSVKMSMEHPQVSEDNVYEYINASQANNYISRNKMIILFGTSNEWTGYYASILNDVAKEVGINKIYYYDFEEDRNRNNATYQNIVSHFNNYVLHLDDGTAELYGPTLIIINEGVISLFDDETSHIHGSTKPQDYWNEYNLNLKKNTLRVALSDYKGS